ncbi:MAG TPA: phosphatase PAP2 family protein [Thermoanaerobaculia bacterium]|nr:phosphatase PAP2 family protein [Thermoanaerobaculia bacterium]
MVASRRIAPRPYFFELFVLANLALIFILTSRANPFVLTTIPTTFRSFIPTLLGYAVAGVVLRCIVAAVRGQLKGYLRHIRTAGWLADTARLVFFGATMVHAYFWIKFVVPLMRPGLLDQELWDLDQAMMFGFSPNILFLDLFSNPVAMRVIDWSYARIFFASMTMAFIFFLSSPSRRVRVAFSTGNSIMWLIGSWLYMLIPSLGPAFRFPEVWLPFAEGLPMTQFFQAMLMANYREVLQLPLGTANDPQLMLGIGAFPSLHVAFQTYAFLWMRRLWIYGQIVFGVFAVVILIGSVVTGWHYLVDGLAGIVLAAVSYMIAARLWNLREWRRLRAATRR